MDEALDGQMLGSGLQVLAKGEDVGALRGDFLHRWQHFVAFLRPGRASGRSWWEGPEAFPGAAQQFERTLVDCALANFAIEARNGFRVVVEHVRAGGDYGFESLPVAAKIGDENFDFAAGTRRRISEMVRAKMAAPPSGWSSRFTLK